MPIGPPIWSMTMGRSGCARQIASTSSSCVWKHQMSSDRPRLPDRAMAAWVRGSLQHAGAASAACAPPRSHPRRCGGGCRGSARRRRGYAPPSPDRRVAQRRDRAIRRWRRRCGSGRSARSRSARPCPRRTRSRRPGAVPAGRRRGTSSGTARRRSRRCGGRWTGRPEIRRTGSAGPGASQRW